MMLSERSKINAAINKELLLRSGAENMLKSLGEISKKEKKEIKERREDILVTLSFCNARIQQLRR